jgi:hypothetical protein
MIPISDDQINGISPTRGIGYEIDMKRLALKILKLEGSFQ